MTLLPTSRYAGRLLRALQVLTSGTSYSKPAGCNAILVELVGGGGGGGGVTSNASFSAGGGGGAGGAYARKYFDVSALAGPFTYAVGGGGNGGADTGGTGVKGGESTFTVDGVTVTASGGFGGGGALANSALPAFHNGGAGALSTGGDVNGAGMPGEHAHRPSAVMARSGRGGSSPFGGGSAGLTAGTAGEGGAGFLYGGGGGGALSISGSGAAVGGDGADGVIFVWEFG